MISLKLRQQTSNRSTGLREKYGPKQKAFTEDNFPLIPWIYWQKYCEGHVSLTNITQEHAFQKKWISTQDNSVKLTESLLNNWEGI